MTYTLPEDRDDALARAKRTNERTLQQMASVAPVSGKKPYAPQPLPKTGTP